MVIVNYRKLIVIITIPVIFFTIFYFPSIWLLSDIDYYQNIIKENSTEEILVDLRNRFDTSYDFTELSQWEHKHLNYTKSEITRHTNSIEILECGKGRCGEFAILYMALCLAHGHQCRLVLDMLGDHVWTQIKVGDQWVHFDPSAKPDDPKQTDPLSYEKDKNTPVYLILAIEKTTFEDVTSNYKNGFWINILSLKMLFALFLLSFLFFFIVTWSKVRREFYKFHFRISGIRKAIGDAYENNLHLLYLFRFLFMFFLPISIIGLLMVQLNQDIVLTSLLSGFTLVVFSALQMPALTKPKMYISLIESCKDQERCKNKQINKKSKDCKLRAGTICKGKESFLEIKKGKKRLVTFRFANLSLHTLKNCTVIFSFPTNIKPCWYESEYMGVDFQKKFTFQKINNALRFSSMDNDLTAPPQECFAFPIIIEAGEENKKTDKIHIQIFSETTWARTEEEFKVVYS